MLGGMDTPLPDGLHGALVAAVDDSPAAREALRFAASLAKGTGRPLAVVTVWNLVRGPAPQRDPDEPPDVAAWQAEAERVLSALVAEEVTDPDVEVQQVALHGNTVPVLLAVSEVAQHVVVGSRGRGGFSGLLLGSTSEQLVHYAAAPVTVVREGSTGS
jgi:nucleotide-binding universal stress UspA family protein